MTDLRCEACHCSYNDNCYCVRHKINVGGHTATKKSETCCESFKPEGTVTNVCISKGPEGKLIIKCEAVKCAYNDNKYCSAECVDIGDLSAETSKETKCNTFRSR